MKKTMFFRKIVELRPLQPQSTSQQMNYFYSPGKKKILNKNTKKKCNIFLPFFSEKGTLEKAQSWIFEFGEAKAKAKWTERGYPYQIFYKAVRQLDWVDYVIKKQKRQIKIEKLADTMSSLSVSETLR